VRRWGVTEGVTAFAPGRINLIGEHTDYNEGLALAFAIGAGVTVRASPREGRRIEAIATDLGERDSFDLDEPRPALVLEEPRPAPDWRAFLRGVAGELRRAGLPIRGAVLEISATVPRGAGLSSSAALEVALCLALLACSGTPAPERIELARICSRVENDWVGARTGLLDQLASLYGEAGSALLIDFRGVNVRTVPLALGGARLAMLDSGERRENAASAYNRRRAECSRACRDLGLPSLRDLEPAMVARLPSPLKERACHVLTENRRVAQAVAALHRQDPDQLGALLDASHVSLRDFYEVSTPRVQAAVARMHSAGALGARIVGGGFGGHVLGLLPGDAPTPEGAVEVWPGPGARVRVV